MNKRELWLKLFSENDTALASAIHLCERFVTLEHLESGQEFLAQKRRELYTEVDRETVEVIFPGYYAEQEAQEADLRKPAFVYCNRRYSVGQVGDTLKIYDERGREVVAPSDGLVRLAKRILQTLACKEVTGE